RAGRRRRTPALRKARPAPAGRRPSGRVLQLSWDSRGSRHPRSPRIICRSACLKRTRSCDKTVKKIKHERHEGYEEHEIPLGEFVPFVLFAPSWLRLVCREAVKQ